MEFLLSQLQKLWKFLHFFFVHALQDINFHNVNLSNWQGPFALAETNIPLVVRYLEDDHYRFCVPSNVSSGLASLPLAHVWIDGKENTSWPTNTELSTGDKLDGKKAYAMILQYFTTNDMTPMDVHNLGKEQLKILYPLVSTILLLRISYSIRIPSKSLLL